MPKLWTASGRIKTNPGDVGVQQHTNVLGMAQSITVVESEADRLNRVGFAAKCYFSKMRSSDAADRLVGLPNRIASTPGHHT